MQEQRALTALTTHLETTGARPDWHAAIKTAHDTMGRDTALKTWVRYRDRLDTLQVAYRERNAAGEPQLRNGWTPNDRNVESVTATYMTLDGSRRDFAGIVCLIASPEVWIGWDAQAETLVMYKNAGLHIDQD